MPNPIYPLTAQQARYAEICQPLAAKFIARAAERDRAGSFPFENFAYHRASGDPGCFVPVRYGGGGATLSGAVLIAEPLAEGDGSAALSAVMHMQPMGG